MRELKPGRARWSTNMLVDWCEQPLGHGTAVAFSYSSRGFQPSGIREDDGRVYMPGHSPSEHPFRSQ